MRNFFGYFNGSPEVFRLAVMMYIRYSLLLRQVGDLQFECGVDICEEKVRFGGTGSATCLQPKSGGRRVDHRSQSNLGRGFRADQRGDASPLARRCSGR